MPLNRDTSGIISEFRQVDTPPDTSIYRSTRGQAVHISEISEKLFKKLKLKNNSDIETVLQNWENILGKFSQRATPTIITFDTLLVKVENPMLKQELNFDKNSILKKLKLILPEINKIKFI